MFPGRAGCDPRNTVAEVRMDQTEQANGNWISQHLFQQPVSVVLREESITMMDEQALALVLNNLAVGYEVQANTVSQIRAVPEVVVSGKERYLYPRVDEIVELENHLGRGIWYDMTVFEPEIEHIAHEVEVGYRTLQASQERSKIFDAVGRFPRNTQVYVRQENDAVGKYG